MEKPPTSLLRARVLLFSLNSIYLSAYPATSASRLVYLYNGLMIPYVHFFPQQNNSLLKGTKPKLKVPFPPFTPYLFLLFDRSMQIFKVNALFGLLKSPPTRTFSLLGPGG